MRFLRRNSTEEADTATVEVEESGETHVGRGYTPGKGRPTPKRREAERRRGPVAPPPRSTKEAIRRNRELRKKNPVSKEERRAAARERRERMNAGDDRYLLPRDRGPVKAYVRDLVDSRRHVLGLFMPLAIVVFIALLVPYPAVQQYATLLTTVMLLGMIVEGVLNGRRVARQVREKFPKENIKGFSIGWYAFIRASQIRRLRVPKPRVRPGNPVPDPR
ncbi:Protein of unknown function [Amycolatopsis arida]|uniref:DUF3043 domain-containing protein n=1 Tax=Amycolatopsis arida TaxID=587909 RepID=A0A1I5XZG0_9PSEU|nr:DUF3043 domain-containing protein [Amycolatopsis arida]TDX97187.1 Protein of unknown function (DUF3043) [Amycolatopsis arida]SFQ37097.1 Protein of unknown function [Amycolatopsis arida]